MFVLSIDVPSLPSSSTHLQLVVGERRNRESRHRFFFRIFLSSVLFLLRWTLCRRRRRRRRQCSTSMTDFFSRVPIRMKRNTRLQGLRHFQKREKRAFVNYKYWMKRIFFPTRKITMLSFSNQSMFSMEKKIEKSGPTSKHR